MDFFGEQTRARRKTRWLIFWFLLAVAGIIAAIYCAVTLVFMQHFWSTTRFLWTFLIVGGGIAAASLYKIAQISRKGGAFVAIELGGRPVWRDSNDPLERRLVNVIDEMSIASGIPAPQAFILNEESGLNAFAAGMTVNDSVIAVTRGLLEHMNRDQLQGVIGHEISHIVNGDTRLNLWLIGILHGIFCLTLAGRSISSRSQGKNISFIILLDVLLFIIGSIGLFFGRLIQSAVSREREYLADASAVQFTRNPDGLADALRQLGGFGSDIQHPNAAAASHLFFGEGKKGLFSFVPSLFATHPPIEKRIARIDKNFNPARVSRRQPASGAALSDRVPAAIGFSNIAYAPEAAEIAAHIEYARNFLAGISPPVREATHQPEGAAATVYALLLSSRAEIRQQQIDHITQTHRPETAETALACARWLADNGPQSRLPLLDLALPTLRDTSADERRRVLECVEALVQADGRLSASEFALRCLLTRVLAPRPPSVSLRLERLDDDMAILLGLLSSAGNSDEADIHAAFQHAATLAPAQKPLSFPEKAKLRPKAIEAALEHLAHAAPHFREKLLNACVAAVAHDGKITVAESELVRAFAQSLDCPAPPVLPD
ncbi:MAG: M48 family metallopeptidase [Zoogloeaceae bacterium]|jgi:Zn-dependent protease with chaperone function|nr:M48 family metallopeptidase [Zoogloeaceae bacterium]